MDGAGVAVPAPGLSHGLIPRHRSAEIHAGIKFTYGKKPAAYECLSCFQFGLSVASTNPAGMRMRHMQRHYFFKKSVDLDDKCWRGIRADG
jgi:hypothetical protein